MKLATYEGVVDSGTVRLPSDVRLPDRTRVYVVVPEEGRSHARILSPRLAEPEQASDFKKKVVEAAPDAGL